MTMISGTESERAHARETLEAVIAKLEEALKLQTQVERERSDDE